MIKYKNRDFEVCPAGTMCELVATRHTLMLQGKLLRDLLKMFPRPRDGKTEPETVRRARRSAK